MFFFQEVDIYIYIYKYPLTQRFPLLKILYVDKKWQQHIHPVATSFGYPTKDFHEQFSYLGTENMTSYLCIPEALKFRQLLGGEDKIMAYNHQLAVEGAQLVAQIWGTDYLKCVDEGCSVSGEEIIPAMCNVRLPGFKATSLNEGYMTGFQNKILLPMGIVVNVFKLDHVWFVRFSAQVWNEIDDFRKCASIILNLLNGGVGADSLGGASKL